MVVAVGAFLGSLVLGGGPEMDSSVFKVIFTRAKLNPRACEPADLLSQFNEQSGKMAQTAANLEDALRLASRAVSREDLIVVTGSFYLAGEAKKFFIDLPNRKPDPTPAHRRMRRR